MIDPSLSIMRRVDDVCCRFEAACRADARPSIEEFLSQVPAEVRPILLRQLIPIEFFHRRQCGDAPRYDDYARRFPEFDPLWLAEPASTIAGKHGEPGPTRLGGAIAAEKSPELPTIRGYEILGVCGRGGMGVVYRARHLQLDRVVALKMIAGRIMDDPTAALRFYREMRAAARLSHKNIVTVYDAGQADDVPFFTMELLEGADLAALVRKNGPLPVAQACDYVRQTALALEHALERGLIHRDVKPGNLFLTATEGIIKVLDLGLARAITNPIDQAAPNEAAPNEVTPEGMVLGTPDYAAPEQLMAPASVDTRADLYSLGCTFYTLLTGKVPFSERAAFVKIARHLSGDGPAPVESLRPDVPPAVAAVVRKLMAKRPEDRFQTPAELIAVLNAASVPAPPRNRRLLLGSFAVAFAVVLSAIGWWAWHRNAAESLPQVEDRRATEALRAHGFEITIRIAGGSERILKSTDALPNEPFTVSSVLVEPGALFDANFVRDTFLPAVIGLRQLSNIKDYGGRMAWAPNDLTVLAGSPVGTSLVLFESGIPLTLPNLTQLQRFTELTSLQSNARDADDAVLKRLKELSGLTHLRLDHLGKHGPVTQEGRALVTSLPLRGLGLYEPASFDRKFAELVAGMPRLTDCTIWTADPLDDLLTVLVGAPNLDILAVSSTVTDAGLEKLRESEGAQRLRRLVLLGNKRVSEAGARRLSQALPKCEITLDGAFIPAREK